MGHYDSCRDGYKPFVSKESTLVGEAVARCILDKKGFDFDIIKSALFVYVTDDATRKWYEIRYERSGQTYILTVQWKEWRKERNKILG